MSENNTKARAAMVRHLAAAIRLRGLQTAEAAAWLDVPQEKIEAMQRGDADTFSLAELEAMAQAGERRETEPQIPADTVFHLALYERLQPHSEWRGGRLADTDLLTLEEAAAFASKHAGEEITARDFLRAAGRGEITLRAIVHRAAKVRKHDGGVYCNKGEPNENIVPAGCIANLPLTACQRLANAGRASWRTFDSFEAIDGIRMRYTKGMLTDDEPDFETVPDDCRVVGDDVHALADEYCAPEDAPHAATPAPLTDRPSSAPAWTVNKPQRYNGYAAPLHRLLAAAHRDGNPCPTARDVVEAWRNNAPAEIAKVLPDGFDYYDAKGNTKTADLNAIRKAIGRMTIAR